MKLQSTYIHLRSVRFHAFIGVGEQERKVGNEYLLDLRLGYPFARAIETDDVEDTLNYADVFETVRQTIARPTRLLEHAAGNIVHALEEQYPKIESIDLTLTKLNPPMGADCAGASVELHLKGTQLEPYTKTETEK